MNICFGMLQTDIQRESITNRNSFYLGDYPIGQMKDLLRDNPFFV